MYNYQKIIDLLKDNNIKSKTLLQAIGKNWNGSVEAVIKGDIRVSKLEKIADFFGVPIDTFFDRETSNNGVSVSGTSNRVHNFTVNNHYDVKSLQTLLEEKDKRIKTLEDMIEILKEVNAKK